MKSLRDMGRILFEIPVDEMELFKLALQHLVGCPGHWDKKDAAEKLLGEVEEVLDDDNEDDDG